MSRALCEEYLMEEGWQEGFICTLSRNHKGPHRCGDSFHGVNRGTDEHGRKYSYVYEWAYQELPDELAVTEDKPNTFPVLIDSDGTVEDPQRIRYLGVLQDDGSMMVSWIWKGQIKNRLYAPNLMNLFENEQDVFVIKLIDIAEGGPK